MTSNREIGRTYYTQRGSLIIVMLGGGAKPTQSADISAAIEVAQRLEEMAISENIPLSSLRRFDAAEHLNSDADIAEYLSAILETGDESLLASALGDVAKARGMTAMAAASGITREALYRALRPGAKPRYDTIQKVIKALGYRLTVQKMSG